MIGRGAARADSAARVFLFGLLLMQPLWHGLTLAPLWPRWLVVLLASVPLLLPVVAVLRGNPRGLFWGALVGLGYFCHGVAELWAAPDQRVPAAVQVTLSLSLVLAVGAGGWLRRRSARRSQQPTPP